MQTTTTSPPNASPTGWPIPAGRASALLDRPTREYARRRISHVAGDLIGTAGLTWADYDDVRQEMWLDLVERLKGFDAGRAQLRTFIARVTAHKAQDIRQERGCLCRDWRREETTLDETISDEDGRSVRRADTLPENVHEARIGMRLPDLQHREVTIDIQDTINTLPPELRVVCELLKTQSTAQVAQRLGLKRTALYRRIARIREQFEEAGLQRCCEG